MCSINDRFIAIEGGEGSGKTTLINALREKFSFLQKEDVIFTREPGGTKVANKIRAILMDPEIDEGMSVRTEILLFLAARANIVDRLIRPALKEGKIVICDRFDGSTVAYQIYGRKKEQLRDIVCEINDFAKGKNNTDHFVTPGLVILLDITPEEGLQRVGLRHDTKTRFDREVLSFHERVRHGFLAQAHANKNWRIVDASRSPEDIFTDVWHIIADFLHI